MSLKIAPLFAESIAEYFLAQEADAICARHEDPLELVKQPLRSGSDESTTSKVEALYQRIRCNAESGRWAEMIADTSLLLEMGSELPVENAAECLIDRAVARTCRGEWARAVEDATHVIEMDPPPSQAAIIVAHWRRGQAREVQGNWDSALRDYSCFIGDARTPRPSCWRGRASTGGSSMKKQETEKGPSKISNAWTSLWRQAICILYLSKK